MEVVEKSCRVCAKPLSKNKCSVCERARYCGKECQRKDWSIHKLDCYDTVNECNRVVRYIIDAPREWLIKAAVRGNHVIHLITLSSLAEIKDAQRGVYARHVCSSKLPDEWKTVYPLSIVNYDTSKKHCIIMLSIKCSASENKHYYFAFALGKHTAEDDTMTMVISRESGMAFYQIKPEWQKSNVPAVVISGPPL